MTIGNFDGVHLAHQKIIHKVVAEAHEIDQKAVVMTFEPHPQKILRPDQSPFFLITTLEEKMAVLESLGIDAAVVIGFSRDFAKTTAAEFIDNVICGKLHPKKILIGHDYTFGRGKEGKP
jgi:riboflavin kinase/FMN adenylyltransferase